MAISDTVRMADLLALFTSSLPVRVWLKDNRGAYIFVNDRMVSDFSIERQKWIGSTDEQLFPDISRAIRRNDLAVLSDGQPLRTTDLIERQGVREYALVLRFPVEIDGERHLGGLGIDVKNEISGLLELHRVQEQRHRNERLRSLGELVSGLVHDLSNSLNAARLRLDVLRAKVEDDSKVQDDVDVVIRSITAAAERIRGVQDFVRAGRDTELTSLDLKLLIHDAIELVDAVLKSPTLFGGRIQIECNLPESLPLVIGLSTELKHVFANLLLNARDAMEEGGAIKVTAKTSVDTVTVVVADNGPGISPENLAKVFSPFFTTKPTGSGLGLSMAKDVMTRIGGAITVANAAAGGAEFVLTFQKANSE